MALCINIPQVIQSSTWHRNAHLGVLLPVLVQLALEVGIPFCVFFTCEACDAMYIAAAATDRYTLLY